MLLFRSEDAAGAWSKARDHVTGPMVTVDQLWELAQRWYGRRLEPDYRRPEPDEIRGLFAALGLRGAFWDPAPAPAAGVTG